ncbi:MULTISPECIES: hypothetical protein [Spirulina sp. CCY15215]|uniref:hypothetical protein n=1 Tax=Spirulina sp. CCY15215 TaxID=2767591 RepID=UPI00194E711B|nr:hypothetical protein [Spirulina major]
MSKNNEPHQSETFLGFTTYTFCGKTQDCGQPAFEVLAKELNFLGEIADRNFAEEIKQNYRD